MEIPGNDFKAKGKAIQDRIKVTGEKTAKADVSGGPSGAKELRVVSISLYLQRLRTSKKLTKPLKTPPILEWRKLIELRPQSPREAFTLTVTN